MRSERSIRGVASDILEKKYFDDVEDLIVSRLHAETDSTAGREELMRTTGIKDARLIQELVDLGITASGLIALRLLPLVMVAWAEHRVNEPERRAVMAAASELGINDGSVAHVLLDHWLKRLPPAESVDAWKRLMHETTEKMSKPACEKLMRRMELQMTNVAKCSGGHLGFGKVSKKERQMIDGLLVSLRNQLPIR